MLEAKGVRIKDFPEGEALWRVDWMEGIKKNPHVETEHLISVFLTKLNCNNDSPFYPLDRRLLDREHRFIAEIGVGLLAIVWNGSVWQNGYRVDDVVQYATPQLTIDTSLAKSIKFSSCSDSLGNARLIPAAQYPLGGKAWMTVQQSTLFLLPHSGEFHEILIPAIEVIRFYYIHSSSSARAIFYGQYESLFSDAECNSNLPLPPVKLTLGWFARHEDAWMLARYSASETVRGRVAKIHDWVTLGIVNGVIAEISESLFPFDGVTKLTAEGVPIKGDDGKSRFLVTRLRHCSHPMPYSVPDVTIRIESKPTIPEELEVRTPIFYKTWPKGTDPKENHFLHDEEPDKNTARKLLEANESRFEALKGAKLIKEKLPPRPRDFVQKPIDSDEIKTGLGTSEGTYGNSNTLRAEITQNLAADDDSPPISLINFVNALAYLRSQNLDVNTRQVGKDVGYFKKEKISYFSKVGNSKRQWSVIHSEPTKQRGLIVAKVVSRGRCAYVMEIERDPTRSGDRYSVLVISSPTYTEIPDIEIESLMEKCQLIGRWPPKKETRQYLRDYAPHRTLDKKSSVDSAHSEDLVDPDMGARIFSALCRIGLMGNID